MCVCVCVCTIKCEYINILMLAFNSGQMLFQSPVFVVHTSKSDLCRLPFKSVNLINSITIFSAYWGSSLSQLTAHLCLVTFGVHLPV